MSDRFEKAQKAAEIGGMVVSGVTLILKVTGLFRGK